VKDALEAYRERYGDRIRVADTDGLGGMLVLIDPIRLDQIMDNLIANAVESMDGREFIPPDLYGEMRQGRALLRVADRGTGIADADKERVFDLFHTTKTDGAGIGLSLAKRYAESAEGSVRHEPRPGGGTIFTLDLPTRKGNAD
jgi:signal transduction histidine kinase